MIRFVIAIFFLFSARVDYGQIIPTDSSGKLHYHTELAGTFINGAKVPFWLRTNKFGSIPINGNSVSAIAAIDKGYNISEKKIVDWGFGFEGRVNEGSEANFIIGEAYLKARVSIFQLKAGRSKDIVGLIDSSLSVGSFSVSGNALGVPKVEISIPQYWSLPYTNKLLAVKGSIAHGWLGDARLRASPSNLVSEVNSYYHELSVYGRFGKPQWRLKLYGGFNHFVIWGNEKEIYGAENYTLNNLQTYYYIALGKPYLKAPTGTSKIGNHLGSIDQAVEYTFKRTQLFIYHQFFYDVGGLFHGNNLKDGLFGISLSNKQMKNLWGWKKILFEYWNSKSQGGEPGAAITPSGDEDYYNNYLYYDAWNYKGENIGNNFLTNRQYARTDLPNRDKEYIVNSRVSLFHLGVEAKLAGVICTARLSYSNNYGTYGSSPWGNSTGGIRHPGPPPYFEKVNQFSCSFEAVKTIKNGYAIAIVYAADKGMLLYNTSGFQVNFSKRW